MSTFLSMEGTNQERQMQGSKYRDTRGAPKPDSPHISASKNIIKPCTIIRDGTVTGTFQYCNESKQKTFVSLFDVE